MSTEDYVNDPLWPVLVETVHAMVLYPHHKAYVKRVVILERPDITYRDLAMFMGLAVGEAMVVLHELRVEAARSKPESDK